MKNFPIRHILGGLTGVSIIVSVILLITPGLPLGIDFTAGTVITYRWETDPTITAVRQGFIDANFPSAVIQNSGAGEYIARISPLQEGEKSTLDIALTNSTGETPLTLDLSSIGPSIAQETITNSLIAIGVSLIIVMIFILYSFRSIANPIRYSIIAIIALLHDVLITLGLLILASLLFGNQLNTAFIVAIITVIGYSINDTIVIFDKIRENIKLAPEADFANTVNWSVQQSIMRSLGTSFTTAIVVLALLLLGGATLRDFLFVILFGIVAGTYSSLFVAPQMLILWQNKGLRFFKRLRPSANRG